MMIISGSNRCGPGAIWIILPCSRTFQITCHMRVFSYNFSQKSESNADDVIVVSWSGRIDWKGRDAGKIWTPARVTRFNFATNSLCKVYRKVVPGETHNLSNCLWTYMQNLKALSKSKAWWKKAQEWRWERYDKLASFSSFTSFSLTSVTIKECRLIRF